MQASRRHFLRQCVTMSSAAVGSLALANLPRVVGQEPIQRNGTPQFQFSLAAYSYRNYLKAAAGEKPQLTLADFIDDCAKFGLNGTELTSYYFPNPVTPEYLRSLKRQCFRLGLDISGTAVGNDFGFPEGEDRRRQLEDLKRWIDYAEILGAPVIRVFAGKRKRDVEEQESHRLMVAGLQECCDYAGQHGVHLALENHGGPTATADGMLALVRDVSSPWFGVNLDTGNFHTEDIYGDLAKVAPFALNVQVKVVVSGPDRRKEPTNFKRLGQIMRDVNYRGYIVLEYEENEDPRTECPKYIAQLREAFTV